jgi:hypothetical protein
MIRVHVLESRKSGHRGEHKKSHKGAIGKRNANSAATALAKPSSGPVSDHTQPNIIRVTIMRSTVTPSHKSSHKN